MDEEKKKQETPEVISHKFNTIVFGMPNGSSIIFFCCPFCYAVYIFPQELFKSNKAFCNCGARFSTLGQATKYIKGDEII